MKCKACGSNNVLEAEEEYATMYGFDTIMEYSICKDCKREFVSKKQILENEKRYFYQNNNTIE